jgi:hypothetical protein
VSFNFQVCIIFIHNLLLIFNSDKLVTSRENKKISLTLFVKVGRYSLVSERFALKTLDLTLV